MTSILKNIGLARCAQEFIGGGLALFQRGGRWFLLLGAALTCPAAFAQQFTTLYSFSETGDGGFPGSTLTEIGPGVFIGTATTTLFNITRSGTFTTLATFSQAAGYSTPGALYPASNGLLYGTNDSGNGTLTGSVYATDTQGKVKVLEANPFAASPLIQASDGNLYRGAGAAPDDEYFIIRLSKAGVMTRVYSLGPYARVSGPLLQASDGNLYGTTTTSNSSGGIVFRISLGGVFTQLSQFATYIAGQGGLVQANNGNLYGITIGFKPTCPRAVGSIFELTLAGEFKTIYDLPHSCYPIDSGPTAGLVEASDGYLYGVTSAGGAYGEGSIFKIALDGSNYTTLENLQYPFSGVAPGSAGAAFVQGSDGAFYGTTNSGGAYQFGTVYRYDTGLPPPLPGVHYFQPSSAAPGASVLITGTHLIGLTGISFNGVPATQISSRGVNYAVAVVPPGATTGPITVTTGNGSTTSKNNFTVQ